MSDRRPRTTDGLPGETLRTGVSLAIFVHLFCVLVVLGGNFAPSDLQERLVGILGPYTRTLRLDPNFAPYHLTSGQGEQRLHQWLVETPDGTTYRFPDRQWRGGFPRQRLDMMARVAAFYAASDVDEIPAEMARGVARRAVARRGQPLQPGEQLYVRCVRYLDESDPSDRQIRDDAGVSVIYEADVWRDGDGNWSVLKRSPASQVAPPVAGDGQG